MKTKMVFLGVAAALSLPMAVVHTAVAGPPHVPEPAPDVSVEFPAIIAENDCCRDVIVTGDSKVAFVHDDQQGLFRWDLTPGGTAQLIAGAVFDRNGTIDASIDGTRALFSQTLAGVLGEWSVSDGFRVVPEADGCDFYRGSDNLGRYIVYCGNEWRILKWGTGEPVVVPIFPGSALGEPIRVYEDGSSVWLDFDRNHTVPTFLPRIVDVSSEGQIVATSELGYHVVDWVFGFRPPREGRKGYTVQLRDQADPFRANVIGFYDVDARQTHFFHSGVAELGGGFVDPVSVGSLSPDGWGTACGGNGCVTGDLLRGRWWTGATFDAATLDNRWHMSSGSTILLRKLDMWATTVIGRSESVCFGVAGSPGDAAIVNLTPVEASGAGNGQLISSDVATPPVASNVNFGPGTVDPNVSVATIGADGKVCYSNSKHSSVHLIADHLGTIPAASYAPATASGAPDRKVDTRTGLGGTLVDPSGRLCFGVAGSPGDAAIVNLTPVEASGPGNGQLISSDVVTAPVASNVNYGPGSIDPNVAVTKIGADGKVCYSNSKHSSVHLIADHLGTIPAASYTPATASGAPDRKVDTRTGIGGTLVGPSERLCFGVAGSPGDAAIVNLTPVQAQGPGNGQLISSDVARPPVASNVNFGSGSVDPNVAVAKIGADGKVCYANSKHASVHLVADHLGTIAATDYTPATPSGAPDRKVDTRIGLR